MLVRAAPPVQVALPAAGGWRAAQAALYGLAASVFALWWLQRPAVALLAGAVAAIAASRRVPMPRGTLAWDGAQWHLAGAACEVAATIDLEGWLLLRIRQADGRGVWAGVGAASAGVHWHAFRCAVYCPRPAPHEADPSDSEPFFPARPPL